MVLASVDQFRDAMDDKKPCGKKSLTDKIFYVLVILKFQAVLMWDALTLKVSINKTCGRIVWGERGRLHLAKLLQAGGNVLLLDEPTNDLDVETLRALENAILEFPGCAMVISHDRWFLDRIATHILDYGDEGKVTSTKVTSLTMRNGRRKPLAQKPPNHTV